MCGITGLYAFNEAGRFNLINLQRTIDKLSHRGPDAQGSYFDDRVGLGHRRLSVIDPSDEANQPMFDEKKKYLIVFNGEIYNFRELKTILENRFGVMFRTRCDTEVLLYAYIHLKEKCLDLFNGFFAFAIYDIKEKELFLARDRLGIKPLYYYQDEDKFLFASEMRSIIGFGIERSINFTSLMLFLQLNYIPAPYAMLNHVHKLQPGHFIRIKGGNVEIMKYYNQPNAGITESHSKIDARNRIRELLEESVRYRMVSDVPLGVFLSGGIDSSIITAIASRYKEDLNTFSIGYPSETYFDETRYADMVAQHFMTNHHTFSLSRNDLLDHVQDILDHIDEPFGDSSAIPVYILSKYTRKHVTVALSGDGADEVFSGYNKHLAFMRSRERSLQNGLIRGLNPLWGMLPQSRNNPVFNAFRQMNRYARGLERPGGERYWMWASLMDAQGAEKMILAENAASIDQEELCRFKGEIISGIADKFDMNEILSADIRLVLPNDMLHKVDLMSMAFGLEVRVPFLDHRLVEAAMGLPAEYKINRKQQKIILRELLADYIPGKLAQRPKHGFEVPLLSWFRKELKNTIRQDLLSPDFVREQGIFDPGAVSRLTSKLFSSDPGDSHAHIWALIVFQSWWKKYFI
ncbi:MAG: asparagine synthase (glutamine-hydrolyzing) [Cyclobacteriaceae bacterium]|nr:asparagine synthase (glutamine-hydrolyzing) [Cyclobacteriaceae bacterium]